MAEPTSPADAELEKRTRHLLIMVAAFEAPLLIAAAYLYIRTQNWLIFSAIIAVAFAGSAFMVLRYLAAVQALKRERAAPATKPESANPDIVL